MNKCEVIFNADILNCKQFKNTQCALLINEGIEDGETTQILQGLEKLSDSYLKILAGNEAGAIYNKCALHDEIQALAIMLLKKRNSG